MSAIELLLLSSRLDSLPLVLANRPRILSFVMFLWSDGETSAGWAAPIREHRLSPASSWETVHS